MGIERCPKGLRAAKAALYFLYEVTIRCFVYIDSRNLHYQLEDKGIDSYAFDYSALAKMLADKKKLVCTKFYCAKYPSKLDIVKHNRDHALFTHLEQAQGVVVKQGMYKFDSTNLALPPKEKGVDVLLATELLFDGFMSSYDCAYVVSDDSDIIPAIEKLHSYAPSLPVYQATFVPKQEWKRVCKGVVQLYPNRLKKMSTAVKPTAATLSDLAAKFKPGK